MSNISDIKLINIPKITAEDGRGNLSVIEKNIIPFRVKRVYYLYDVPADSMRGGHAHKVLNQFLIALSGSFDVILNDGEKERKITLNKPFEGLLIPTGIWRELKGFSAGSVCLVLASEEYDESDYIRNYEDFLIAKSKT